jgi:hypothetical protein
MTKESTPISRGTIMIQPIVTSLNISQLNKKNKVLLTPDSPKSSIKKISSTIPKTNKIFKKIINEMEKTKKFNKHACCDSNIIPEKNHVKQFNISESSEYTHYQKRAYERNTFEAKDLMRNYRIKDNKLNIQ